MISPDLPEVCFVFEPTAGGVCAIKRGEPGFHPVQSVSKSQELVDYLNKELGVTPAQVKAMQAGSMFGWHLSAADPKTYEVVK